MASTSFKNSIIFMGLVAVLPQLGWSHTSETELSGHAALSARAQGARRNCLRSARSVPEITFENPKNEWIEMYRPSQASRLTMSIYRPLTHGVGGLVQSVIDRAYGEEEAFEGMSALRALGQEAKQFVQAHELDRMKALCVASCIVAELVYPTDDIPHMLSLDLALSSGAGDCKIYSEAMLVMAEEMGIPMRMTTSWGHAFNQVTYRGADYFVDATRYDGMSCNYVPTEYYSNR